MSDMQQQIRMHFIYKNEIYTMRTSYFLPRAGDEVRFNDKAVFEVKRVVICYDEPTSHYSRANVELIKAKP